MLAPAKGPSAVAAVVILMFVAGAALRCGRDDRTRKPQSPPVAAASNMPSNWDGTTDWADSVFEVVEE